MGLWSVYGKVAVVTGGTRGIGRAVATELLKRGVAGLAIAGTTRSGVDSSVGWLNQSGLGMVKGWVVDVGNPIEVNQWIGEVVSEGWGGRSGIDIAVAGAGISRPGLASLAKDEDLEDMWRVNVGGPMSLARAVLRKGKMGRSEDGGVIVSIGSAVANHGGPVGISGYAATKGALNGWSKSLAAEVGGKGIRVSVIAPGWVETDMTSALPHDGLAAQAVLNRMGTPEDIAHAVMFAVENPFVTGTVIEVDGGIGLNRDVRGRVGARGSSSRNSSSNNEGGEQK